MDVFRKAGKKGGLTTSKRGNKFYKKIGRKGSKMRWGKKKATLVVVSKSGDGLEK